jgi:zinc protease
MPSIIPIVKKLPSPLLSVVLLSSLSFGQSQQPSQAEQKKDSKSKQAAAPAAPPVTPPTPYSEVRRDSLLNGLQLVMLERAAEPTVKIDLVVRGGSMFDLAGKTGLAALTQESLIAANPRLVEELESLRAKIQWGVREDAAWFRIETPPGALDQVLSIFGRLIVVDSVNKDAFARAQRAHLARVRETKTAPGERADDAFRAALYGEHPYGHGTLGTEQTVAAITYGEVYDYYKRLYAANNAFALVVSGVKKDRLVTAFRQFFGGWLKGAPPQPVFRPPQRTTTLRLVKVEQPDAAAVELRGGVIGVKVADPDFIATRLLARVLEGRLRQSAGGAADATGVSVHAPPHTLAGPLYFSASVPTETAPELSRRATDLFAALDKSEFTAQELSAAQAALLAEHNARTVEDYLREIEMYQLPRNHPLTYADRVNAVTTADLQRVARKLLEANALTVVVLGRVGDGFKS